MSVLESATQAANRIIHGDEHSEDEVQLVSGELLQAAALLREYEEAAKRARNLAAAPDYDEEAIRDALWAVVNAVLASGAFGGREA